MIADVVGLGVLFVLIGVWADCLGLGCLVELVDALLCVFRVILIVEFRVVCWI